MKTTRTNKPPEILSASAIADHLGRSPQGVMNAIARLGIEPALSLPSGNYYPLASVAMIEEGMRRKNGTQG